MAAVTICSILEPRNKVCYCFHCFPIYLPWKTNIQGSQLSPVQAEADMLFEALYNKPKPCPFCSGEKVQADFSDAYMMRGDAENIMVVYSPDGVAQAKFTIHACPICKKPL